MTTVVAVTDATTEVPAATDATTEAPVQTERLAHPEKIKKGAHDNVNAEESKVPQSTQRPS